MARSGCGRSRSSYSANLRLGELQSLTALSGFKFSDLPESRQRKINNRSIRGIVLNEHADEQARFDMFERINTGSKIANMAEVRRGALAGPFMDLIIELSVLPKFVALAPVSKKDLSEREHEELVARFFAYSDGLVGYKDRPSEFIFNYVKKMNVEAANDPAFGRSVPRAGSRRPSTSSNGCSRMGSAGLQKGKRYPQGLRFEADCRGIAPRTGRPPRPRQRRHCGRDTVADQRRFHEGHRFGWRQCHRASEGAHRVRAKSTAG